MNAKLANGWTGELVNASQELQRLAPTDIVGTANMSQWPLRSSGISVGDAVASSVAMTQKQFEPLRNRAFAFAVDIVRFCRSLPATYEARKIGEQLFRSGTSIGANYRAAGRSRSDADFISKMNIVVEESDETDYFLRLLIAIGAQGDASADRLRREALELLSIFSASLATARANRKRRLAARRVKKEAERRP